VPELTSVKLAVLDVDGADRVKTEVEAPVESTAPVAVLSREI
jgi:hypothetical protein